MAPALLVGDILTPMRTITEVITWLEPDLNETQPLPQRPHIDVAVSFMVTGRGAPLLDADDKCGGETKRTYNVSAEMDVTSTMATMTIAYDRPLDLCAKCVVAALRARADEIERGVR